MAAGEYLQNMQASAGKDAAVESWETRAEELANRIQRLGPINLAAIDEYKETLQRKEYLDEQDKDVPGALAILEEAEKEADVKLLHVNLKARKLITMAQLVGVFEMFDDEEMAVASFT